MPTSVTDIKEIQNILTLATIVEVITESILQIENTSLAKEICSAPVSHGLISDIVTSELITGLRKQEKSA